MKKYRQLVESLPSKTVVFVFGRFQPITSGHELLIRFATKLAASRHAAHAIYVSRTNDKKDNPLTLEQKLGYLRTLFPDINFVGANDQERTFIEAAKHLNKKYKNLIMIAGSDRVQNYTTVLNKYNGKEFNFDSIEVISAGERDPDSDTVTGMSGTKMRKAAKDGNYDDFKKGLIKHMRELDGKRMMNDIRAGYGLEHIKEQVKFSTNSVREKYHNGEIFQEGEHVFSEGQEYTIVKRGSNHLLLECIANGTRVSKWITDVTLSEDTPIGYTPEEISFGGYKTKNLHHSKDAIGAFLETIKRHGTHPDNKKDIVNALKATDAYMKLNDIHLEQGKAPDDKELAKWRQAHQDARKYLQNIGEFMHHMDYWHMHEHEIQDMEGNYNPQTSGAEMNEELTTKTIKSGDKLKIARMIATFLGNEEAESSSNPDQLVTNSLRKIKSQLTHTDSIMMLKKMLKLADEVGIKYDRSSLPAKLKEGMSYTEFMNHLNEADKVDTDDDDDIDDLEIVDVNGKKIDPKDEIAGKVGGTLGSPDHKRRMKVKYKLGEEVEQIDELSKGLLNRYKDAASADELKHRISAYKKTSTSLEIGKAINIPHLGKMVGKALSKNDIAQADKRRKGHELADRKTGGLGNFDYDSNGKYSRKGPAKVMATEDIELDEAKHGFFGTHNKIDIGDTVEHINGASGPVIKIGYQDNKTHIYFKNKKPGIGAGVGEINFGQEGKHVKLIKKKSDKKKPINKEEVEELSEISSELAKSYLKKKIEAIYKRGANSPGPEKTKRDVDALERANRAMMKPYNKEEVELDEDSDEIEFKKQPKTKKKTDQTNVKDDSGQLGANNAKGFDAFFEENDELDNLSDDELDKMANDIDHEDIIDVADDDELAVIDDDSGEEIEEEVNEEALMEVLSRTERMKARIRFAKTKAKRERNIKIALRKTSNTKTINSRARKLAIKKLKMKIAKKPLNKLSVAEKERVERIVQKKKQLVDRLAVKMVPKVRSIERDRLSHHKFTQK